MPRHPIVAVNDGVSLGGSLWTPEPVEPSAVIVMFPGSGPSDRDNDVLFPPIRKHLLGLGIAVASFDKRGVGDSTGDWLTAGIETQAADLAAQVAAVRELLDVDRIGLFGHSQGGWVVLEASRLVSVDFVIANSGPGVTPGVQESYSTANRLADAGTDVDRAREALAIFDELMRLAGANASFAEAERLIERERASVELLETAGAFVPSDPALWALIALLVDYDPAGALEALRVPVLAIFGGADDIVPVDRSVVVFRDRVAEGLLHVAVLEGGDHRMQRGADERFVPDYLPTIDGFLAGVGVI